MEFERAVQAYIVRADLIICAALPVIIALLLFGVAAFLILLVWTSK